MAITPLPTPVPTRNDPENFDVRGDAFLAALPQFGEEANALARAMNLNSTTDASGSSVTIGTGAKTFTVSAGKSFQPGMYLVIADVAAPSTNSMWGQVTSYAGTALVVQVMAVRGSGTKTAWVISQSAPGGAAAGGNNDINSLDALSTVPAVIAAAIAAAAPAGIVSPFVGPLANVPSGYIAVPTAATNVSRTTYARLFAAIGTTWGAGDGSTTFGLPYLPAGYTFIHANTGLGALAVGEVIAHSHTYDRGSAGTVFQSGGNSIPAFTVNTGTASGSTGGSANLAAGAKSVWILKI